MIEFKATELPEDNADNIRWNAIAKNTAVQFNFTYSNKACTNPDHAYYHNILTIFFKMEKEFYVGDMEYTDVCCDAFKEKWIYRDTLN